jgi:hypothetical protein
MTANRVRISVLIHFFYGHLMAVLPLIAPAMNPAETEVGNLEPALTTDEQVGRLQVPVHDVLAVEEGHALQEHLHIALHLKSASVLNVVLLTKRLCSGQAHGHSYLGLRERVCRVLDHLGQVRDHELKHQDKS